MTSNRSPVFKSKLRSAFPNSGHGCADSFKKLCDTRYLLVQRRASHAGSHSAGDITFHSPHVWNRHCCALRAAAASSLPLGNGYASSGQSSRSWTNWFNKMGNVQHSEWQLELATLAFNGGHMLRQNSAVLSVSLVTWVTLACILDPPPSVQSIFELLPVWRHQKHLCLRRLGTFCTAHCVRLQLTNQWANSNGPIRCNDECWWQGPHMETWYTHGFQLSASADKWIAMKYTRWSS